jgi:hypothetical protein
VETPACREAASTLSASSGQCVWTMKSGIERYNIDEMKKYGKQKSS